MTRRTKAQWRADVLSARRALDDDTRAAEARALAESVAAVAAEVGADATVCAYVPVGREPGSTALLDTLADTVGRVLLPVAREPGPLEWARYEGADALVAAPFGLREPRPPYLPPQVVSEAAVLLLPALAVDRRGVRLGRGAGFYDRTLALASGRRLVAVVRDGEFVDRLPEDPHDVRVHEVLTPFGGLRHLDHQE